MKYSKSLLTASLLLPAALSTPLPNHRRHLLISRDSFDDEFDRTQKVVRGVSIAVVVGSVLGALGFIAFLIGICCCIKRRNRRQRAEVEKGRRMQEEYRMQQMGGYAQPAPQSETGPMQYGQVDGVQPVQQAHYGYGDGAVNLKDQSHGYDDGAQSTAKHGI